MYTPCECVFLGGETLYDFRGTRTWENQIIHLKIIRLNRLTTKYLTSDNKIIANDTHALIPL